MFRAVVLLNVILTVSFGLVAVVAPVFTFSQFGLLLNEAGVPVARGYAATALGYGLLLLLLPAAPSAATIRAVLIASTVFNGLELLIQVPLALSGGVKATIWVTIGGHGLAGLLSVLALLRQRGAAV